MVKQHYCSQLSYEETMDALMNYEDIHYQEFCKFLFEDLLTHIRRIRFDDIIRNHLIYEDAVYDTHEAHSLPWLYTADRKLVNSITIYSFRFANICHPDDYKKFNTYNHYLFTKVKKPRHRYCDWYQYMGQNLLHDIDTYLNITNVVQSQIPHKTKLYINQNEERVDIQFDFVCIKERIAICFEPGYPA